jgi:hypothetical protein
MSDDRGHKRSDGKGKFCTAPADKNCDECPGPATGKNNYREVCKPAKWGGFKFRKLVDGESRPFGYEAHHVVCVSPTTTALLGNEKIVGSVEQTEWCINQEKNMLAMPLWGHTVQWYCEIDATGGSIIAGKGPPDFKNIPQHDIDHNSKEGYTWEVLQEVEALAKEIEESGHELEDQSLADALNGLSDDFKNKLLQDRGTRKGGTDAGWQLGQQDPPDPGWCHPFSMASTAKVTSMAYPARKFDKKLQAWIDRLAKAVSGE